MRAKDDAGNVDASPASRTFTVDTAAPATTITSGPANGTTINDSTPTFAFTSTETGSTFECRVDNGPWAGCTSAHTTATLAVGDHTFEVRATDPAGNTDQTPEGRTFTVAAPDTTPPDTEITTGPSGPTNDNTPTFAFTATEAGSTFECRIDGGAWAACTSPRTLAALERRRTQLRGAGHGRGRATSIEPRQPQLQRRHRRPGHQHHLRTDRTHQRQHANLRVQLARDGRELRVQRRRR